MALLGKISAVLTANTQDFSRQIGTARRELNQFAQQARGLQFNLDNRALNNTLTQLQRFQRTIREIQNLQRQGLGAGLPDPGRLRQQLRAFEDVGRPLTDVKNQIERLSNSLQSQLTPELSRVQSGFQRLYREIGSGATTYAQAEQRIDNLRARLVALGRATAAVGDFGRLADALNANNSGGSFFQARARDSLQRSLDLRTRAQNVPAAFRSDAFADLAVAAEESAERVARAAARVARAQLDIANTERSGGTASPRQLLQRGVAQQRLDSAVSQQEAVNSLFSRELRSAQIQQIVSPRATEQVDRLIDRLGVLSAEARTLGGNRFSGLINAASSLVDQFNRGTASAAAATRAVGQLDRALNGVRQNGPVNILADQTNRLLFSQSDMMRRRIQGDFDSLSAGRAPTDPVRLDTRIDRDVALGRLNLNDNVIPRTQAIAARAQDSGDQNAIRDAGRVLQLNQQINAEYERAIRLRNAGNYREAEASLTRVNYLLQRQQDIEQQVSRTVENTLAARRQNELFLQASGGSAEQLSQGARDAAADISVGRQFRGQIASGASRIQIDAEIRRTETAVQRLQRAMADVTNSGLSTDQMVAELDRLDNEIRQATQSLARFIAVRSNGAFGEDQISAAMERARNTAGSITTRGAATVQLAAQQGLFAIDDLLSATGGLEYRLRAVGNNITQLGLLLGQSGVIPGLSATTGLMIGLGVVIGGQVVSALLRYVTAAKESEETTKALAKSFERQKTLSSQVAQNVESLGNQLSGGAFSEAARSANEFADALAKVARQQKELFGESLLSTDTAGVNLLRADERLAQQQEEAATPGRAIAIRRQRAILARQVAAREEALRAQGAPDGVDAFRAIEALGRNLERRRQSIQGINATVDALATGRFGENMSAAFGYDASPQLRAVAGRARGMARRLPVGDSQEDRAAQISAIQELIDQLSPVGNQTFGGYETSAAQAANEAIAELEQLRLRLQGEGDIAEFFKSLRNASQNLATAQQNAAAALERGIPQAVAIQGSLDALGKSIQESEDRIARANEDLSKGRIDDSERNRIVAEEARKIEAGVAERNRVAGQARDLRARATVDPQNTPTAAADRAAASLQSSGFGSGIFARRLREIEAQRQTVEDQLKNAGGNQAVQQAAQADLTALAGQTAAVEAATIALSRFAEALDRAAQESSSNVQRAMQRDEDARRAVAAPLGGTEANKAEAARAQEALKVQREADERLQDAISAARFRIERGVDPSSDALRRIREIDNQLASGNAPNAERLIEERRWLQRQVDAAVELDPEVQRARDNSNAVSERQQSKQRGRELALTPAERAGRELAKNLIDLQQALGQDRRMAEFAQKGGRLVDEAMRATAPAIFGMADQVQNAILQGPSRAALQASDVTTAQGAAELNRLLRGDDSARNQDLVELQRQSGYLQELVNHARQNGAPPGVLDL